MGTCTVCKEREAVYLRRYSGQEFCSECFVPYFESKVVSTLKKKAVLERGDRVGVALSGGKDSLTTLSVLSVLSGKLDLELHAIAVDEGIGGYREKTLELAEEHCKKLEVPLHVGSFREHFGCDLDWIVEHGELKPCTYCGVFRRRIIDLKARGLGIKKVATGHNLDDEAQAVLMNYLRGDVERLRGSHNPETENEMIKRIKPLSEMPEKEVALYTILKGFEVPFTECPYSNGTFRGSIRDFLNDLELRHPGAKYRLIRGYEKLFKESGNDGKFKKCEVCGGLSSSDVCKVCKLSQEIRAAMDKYK